MRSRERVKPLRKPKSRFHHGDLFEAAIEVAARELDAHGYAELTLERVAKKLGVTRPALYRHFPDKRALLGEVAQRCFVRFEAALTEAIDSDPDPLQCLLACGRAYLRFCMSNVEWFRLQFTAPASLRPMPDLKAAPPRYSLKIYEALAELLGKTNPDVQNGYVALWGILHGLAGLVIEVWAGASEDDRLSWADEALRVHLVGLAAHSRELDEKKKREQR